MIRRKIQSEGSKFISIGCKFLGCSKNKIFVEASVLHFKHKVHKLPFLSETRMRFRLMPIVDVRRRRRRRHEMIFF